MMDQRFLTVKFGEKMIDCLLFGIVDTAFAMTPGYYILRGEHQSTTMNRSAHAEGVERCGIKFDGIFKNFNTTEQLHSPEYGFLETAKTKIEDWGSKLRTDEKKILVGSSYVMDELERTPDGQTQHGSKTFGLVATGELQLLRFLLIFVLGSNNYRPCSTLQY